MCSTRRSERSSWQRMPQASVGSERTRRAQMSHREEYKGHQITVDTHSVGRGFRWSYQIDGGEIRDCKDRPLRSEQVVLSEGIPAARAEIDHEST
jgi:hypothetical protein